jgi:hypothetical protein
VNDFLRFEGVSRSVLEARIARLVATIDAIEQRLAGRADTNHRLAALHPDPAVQLAGAIRERAYQTALLDLAELLSSPAPP